MNNHLTVLKRMFSSAEEWGLVDRVPTIRRLKVPDRMRDAISVLDRPKG